MKKIAVLNPKLNKILGGLKKVVTAPARAYTHAGQAVGAKLESNKVTSKVLHRGLEELHDLMAVPKHLGHVIKLAKYESFADELNSINKR